MAGQAKTEKTVPGLAERVLELKVPSESNNAFAKRLGVTGQSVSNWRHGRESPSLPIIVRIVERTNASALWLLTGQGPREAVGEEEAVLRLTLAKTALTAPPEEIEGLLSQILRAQKKAPRPRKSRASISAHLGADGEVKMAREKKKRRGKADGA